MIENYIDTILLPHNGEAYQKVIGHFCSNQRAAVVHATGTGKSFIIAAVTGHFNKVVVIAPNNFVLDETRKLCGGNVTFRTYASVMCDDYPVSGYDLIVLDEFHRAGADKWGEGVARLIAANPDAKLLGTSATAIRYLDGERNMADELFDGNVVSSLPLREAIDRDIIPEPTYVASLYAFTETYLAVKNRIMASNKKTEEEKMKALHTLNGIAHNWKNAQGVGLIMRKYLGRDIKRIIVFCSKVERAAKAREILGPWLATAGFRRMRFYNIDYKEKHLEREMADFQEDYFDGVKVAISVNMLNEGVHIPNVDAVVMMRSTVSPNIILQQIGRCLTAKKTGHKPVIIDLVNNMDTLGQTCGWQFSETRTATGVKDDDHSLDKGFPFHIIDECRDIRTFLTQIQNEFEVVTDFYPKFWEFVGLHGRMPKQRVKGEKPLYFWCRRVARNCCGLKDRFPDVYAKMRELGWLARDEMMEARAEEFFEFVGLHGRLPKKVGKGEKSLYRWCCAVAGNLRGLRERYPDVWEKMSEMGWMTNDEMTGAKIKEFWEFVGLHGRMPKQSVKGEKLLYKWCCNVARNYRGLRERFPDVWEKMKEMGWKSPDEKTETKAKEFWEFVGLHGRLPKKSVKGEFSLYHWCQRVAGNLNGLKERFPEVWEKMRELGWKSPDEKMKARAKEFFEFVGLYGRLPKARVKGEKSLYRWCCAVAGNDCGLRERFPDVWEKIRELGWLAKDEKTEARVKEFWEFVGLYGRLPKKSVKGELPLYHWCQRVAGNDYGLRERSPEVYAKIMILKGQK